MDEAVEAFTEAHPEGWTVEEEAEMREALQASGVDVTVATSLQNWTQRSAPAPHRR